jgi:hypothetical protein
MDRRALLTVSTFALAFVFTAISSPCRAMMSIDIVSKDRAKVLGMEVRTVGAGPDAVRVELEFEPKGELKKYYRVDLDVNGGGKLELFATLKEEDASRPGRIRVSFAADRVTLEKATLRVVVGSPGNLSGFDLRVKNFVSAEGVKPPQTRR